MDPRRPRRWSASALVAAAAVTLLLALTLFPERHVTVVATARGWRLQWTDRLQDVSLLLGKWR